MSPIDDELRSLLHGRASGLAPSSDPLGGVERRAQRMRHNRRAAAVGVAAVLAGAVAVGIPALLPSHETASLQPADPSPAPSAQASSSGVPRYGHVPFDSARPVAAGGTEGTVVREWANRRGLAGADGEVLWQGTTPAGTAVGVYQLWPASGGKAFLVVAQDSESGPVFVRDTATGGIGLVSAVVAGPTDEPQVVIVSAHASDALDYLPGGTTEWVSVAAAGPGAMTPRRTLPDRVRARDGQTVRAEEAVYVAPTDGAPGASDGEPSGVLPWMTRGRIDEAVFAAAKDLFAAAMGSPGTPVSAHALFGGTDKQGRGYVLAQMWLPGANDAHVVAYVSGQEARLAPTSPVKPVEVVAMVLAYADSEQLVVVPRPGAGRVSYSPTANAPFTQIANGRSELDGVGIVDRDPRATRDRIEVLDGDDNPDRPLYRGFVTPLLCGLKECG